MSYPSQHRFSGSMDLHDLTPLRRSRFTSDGSNETDIAWGSSSYLTSNKYFRISKHDYDSGSVWVAEVTRKFRQYHPAIYNQARAAGFDWPSPAKFQTRRAALAAVAAFVQSCS